MLLGSGSSSSSSSSSSSTNTSSSEDDSGEESDGDTEEREGQPSDDGSDSDSEDKKKRLKVKGKLRPGQRGKSSNRSRESFARNDESAKDAKQGKPSKSRKRHSSSSSSSGEQKRRRKSSKKQSSSSDDGTSIGASPVPSESESEDLSGEDHLPPETPTIPDTGDASQLTVTPEAEVEPPEPDADDAEGTTPTSAE